jgi:hypothetical protein
MAHYCAKAGLKLLVLDKNGSMGGTFNTCRKDDIESIMSQLSFPELLFSLPGMFGARMDGETVESCYSKIVGKRNFEHVAAAGHVVPSPRPGHKKTVAEIDGLLAGSALLLTGNYFTGIAIEDCISRSLQESRRLVH